jgi:hypothetical protein
VKIKLSRHAKRRADLYKIPQSTVDEILDGMNLREGVHEIVKEVKGFQHPLKMVLAVEKDATVLITVYPLKKGRTT